MSSNVPFPVDNAAGAETLSAVSTSGAGRAKALALGIIGTVGVRLVTLVTPFLTLPVTLKYLGPDVFGFWMIVVSITALSSFVDLGLGNGLLTKLPPAFAAGDAKLLRALISSAYAALTVVALGLLALIWAVVPFLDWATLVPGAAVASGPALTQVALACLTGFVIMIPIWLIQRIQYAFQQAWNSNLWQLYSSVATLGAVYLVVAFNLGVFITIAAATAVGPIVMLVKSFIFFGRYPELRPRAREVSWPVGGSLIRLGAGFFFISVLTGIGLNTDNLILARLASLREVGAYALVTRLFNLLPALITLGLLPLWPANADALARNDTAWVKRATRIMLWLSLGAAIVGGGLLVLARNVLMRIWLHSGFEIALALGIAFVVWSTVYVSSSPGFSVQNSVGRLRLQLIGWPVFILLSIPVKIVLYNWIGLPGLPIGSAIAFAVTLLPVSIIGYRAILRTPRGVAFAT